MSESLQDFSATSPVPQVEAVRVLVPSPLGPLAVELTGPAVSRVTIAPTARVRKNYRPFGKMRSSEFLDEVFGRLSEYFAGARRNPEIEHDFGPSGLDSFARRVLRETCKVPYGKTRTYQAIADAAGRPEAYRQVLSILNDNPIPIVIPCHRVVTHKSGVGGYVGGTRKKQWLLKLEEQVVERG
ncbi:MAG: methylated-DNA--[protein]-cysteine S-methyltransferase [Acidobacteriota bacterium]